MPTLAYYVAPLSVNLEHSEFKQGYVALTSYYYCGLFELCLSSIVINIKREYQILGVAEAADH